jgi:glycerophosphoryl diester phosphodiesterase
MFFGNPLVSYNLTQIAEVAHGVGPKSDWLFKYENETFNLTAPSKFIEECHRLGLAVHPYSLQDDMLRWTDSPLDEHITYIDKGIDGIFTEFPHLTKAAFLKFKSQNNFPPQDHLPHWSKYDFD